jgi:hypothetical protein
MAKIRKDEHYPWDEYWAVSFDHYPLVYRGADSVHIVHYFQW